MAVNWGELVLQGWDTLYAATNVPKLEDRLERANYSLSLFEAAHEIVGEDSPFEALIGIIHAYCHLADLETNIAASRNHAQAAATCAEYLLQLWLDQNPIITVTEELLRIKDAFGCALRQRFIYMGDQKDCIRAIELHRSCVKYDFPSNRIKACWNYNLSLALISLIRSDWTIKRMTQILEAFTSGYKALQLSNWSNPLYLITLCSFRIFIVLETKHHSMDWAKRSRLPSGRNNTAPPDVIAFLHMVGTTGGRDWLSMANSLNQSPYIAIIVNLATHITHLLDNSTTALSRQVKDIHQALFDQKYEFDFRHAPYLLDLLGALVRCSRLGLHYGDLIAKLGELLFEKLLTGRRNNSHTRIEVDPTTYHYELPRLLHLIGESHYCRVSELKVRGYRDLDYLPAILYHRAALELTIDGHPRQLLYLNGLAFALAGSAQNTDVQNDDNLEEFGFWFNLIQTLQDEDEDSFARDVTRGEDFMKLDLLVSSIPLETEPEMVGTAIKNSLHIYNQATPGSEQHRLTGVGFANLSMRMAMAIVRSGGNVHTEISYGYIDQAADMWKRLISHYRDVPEINFGYGAALSVRADHMHLLRADKEAARITYGKSVNYMCRSLGTNSPSTVLDIQKRQMLADTYSKHHRLSVALNKDIQDDIEQAILLLKVSIHVSIRENMPATITHSVAKDWSKCAAEFQHPSLLEAYQAQVNAFMQLAWVGFDFNSQVKSLQSAGQALAEDATTCAIRTGSPELAVEMYEACRTVLLLSAASTWNAPLDLRKSHPELVSRLEDLGCKIRELSEANAASSESFAVSSDRKNYLAQQLRDHGIEWDNAVSDVRAVQGYEDFMRITPFERLVGVVSDKLTVSVVTSEEYDCCHALFLIWGEPYVLPLPLTPQKASQIFHQFKAVLKVKFGRGYSNDSSRDIGNEVEETRMKRLNELQFNTATEMAGVLGDLWTFVMQPILHLIKEKIGHQTEPLLHIWINATGHLSSLPLHAAGVYDKDGKSDNGQSVLDHAICSYNPSLSSLRRRPAYSVTSTRVLALGAGENLKHVQEEVKTVSKIFEGKGTVTTFVGEEFDLDHLKMEFPSFQIAHFASHGVQDANNPLNSRLLFHSKSELTLEELMKLVVSKAKLAVLFACETAQGDAKLTNEALHLVGAMLSIGFSGAIGTLWPMADSDGIPVCEVFYKTLLEGEGPDIDYSRAGFALHKAVCALRDDGAGLLRWATFAHFGQ